MALVSDHTVFLDEGQQVILLANVKEVILLLGVVN